MTVLTYTVLLEAVAGILIQSQLSNVGVSLAEYLFVDGSQVGSSAVS